MTNREKVAAALPAGVSEAELDVAEALYNESMDPSGEVSAKKFFLQSLAPERWGPKAQPRQAAVDVEVVVDTFKVHTA